MRAHRPQEAARHGERGSVTLELAVLGPGLIALAFMLIVFGRVHLASGSVEAAAAEASRIASIARSATTAQNAGSEAARASLGEQGLNCQSVSVTIDTDAFRTPPGTPASVSATVTCVVNLAGISLPGLPGAHTITTTAASPLDTYRERR